MKKESKIIFCPKCHRRVVLPKFLLQGNVNAENGVTIKCSNCEGKVKYKTDATANSERV